MGKLLAEHWPHLIFVLFGVVAFFWVAYRPGRQVDDPPLHGVVAMAAALRAEASTQAQPLAPAPPAGTVRRSVARRGLLALGPLVGAVATGGVLYGIDVSGGSGHEVSGHGIPWTVIWVHAGISTLALLLVVYKMAELRPTPMTAIRRALARDRLSDLVSVGLFVTTVPLALTGAALLFAPAAGSSLAYIHLIASVWWTGLLTWHLRRYVGASLRAAFGSEHRADLALERRDVAGQDVPRSLGVTG
ncbi:MAG TPA: hypothetical protein VMF57_13480 [Solirubrobacteraceae bacterium]|nr:hypothetical protein [Solirubrobacteraceae bacterium]